MRSSSLATDYANAFYGVCEEKNIVHEIIFELRTIIDIHDAEITKFINISIIPKKVKKDLVDELVNFNIEPIVINLMKILIDNNQSHIFREVFHEFVRIFQERNDIKVVHVTTARELSSAARENIRVSLEEKLNCFVVLSTVVNPDVIGGVKFEYDGYQLDNTIKRQLKQIKKSIKG